MIFFLLDFLLFWEYFLLQNLYRFLSYIHIKVQNWPKFCNQFNKVMVPSFELFSRSFNLSASRRRCWLCLIISRQEIIKLVVTSLQQTAITTFPNRYSV